MNYIDLYCFLVAQFVKRRYDIVRAFQPQSLAFNLLSSSREATKELTWPAAFKTGGTNWTFEEGEVWSFSPVS